MTEIRSRIFAATGAIIVSTALAAAALANPIDVIAPVEKSDIIVAYVSYEDLDLTTDQGESHLVHRVKRAAVEVCPVSYMDSDALAKRARCKRLAMAGAEPQIAQAVLRARQIARTGRSDIPAVRIALNIR